MVTPATTEQRNPYKGSPARPWAWVRLTDKDGTAHEAELLADTGNPFPIIISQAAMANLKQKTAPDVDTNFGLLQGGWLHLHMPEFGLDHDVIGYASDAVVTSAQTSSPDFQGLAGLPLLRMFEYGGDAQRFWLRAASGKP
jgi:hypothetical protein